MSGKTKIEWADKVWNPVVGCTPVSAGCAHCYARRIYERFYQEKPFSQIQLHPERLEDPLHWRNASRVFVNSMSDLFHEDVPEDFIWSIFSIMAVAEKHTFLVLTKRPERMRDFVNHWQKTFTTDLHSGPDNIFLHSWPLKNVWLGVTAENQQTADERIPLLLETPAAVRFVSVEPMLGPVNIGQYLWEKDSRDYGIDGPALDWVICGGETGPGARAMNPDWARSLRDQCVYAGVPFFFKKWGNRLPVEQMDYLPSEYAPKQKYLGKAADFTSSSKSALHLLDGEKLEQFPEEK